MMSGYYREHRGLFLKSIAFGFLGWVAGVLELYLTLYFLGIPVGFKELWIIEALLQLVRAGSFFIPLSLGAQEGGLILIFTSMGMAGPLGLAVSFVRRIRELVWIALGLLLGWVKASGIQKERPESFSRETKTFNYRTSRRTPRPFPRPNGLRLTDSVNTSFC